MTALTGAAPSTEYNECHWEFDALEVSERWAGAIIPHPTNKRRKLIAFNQELFSGDAIRAS
eukprot:1926163-Alexandrium_andersonii.AAC.1